MTDFLALEDKHKLDRMNQLNDVRTVLSTDAGKRFLMRLVERAGVFQPTYGAGGNINDFVFMEGRREQGLFLMGEITQADHEAWLVMQTMCNELKLKEVDHDRTSATNYD